MFAAFKGRFPKGCLHTKMMPVNDKLDIGLESLCREDSPNKGLPVEHCQRPMCGHDLSKFEDAIEDEGLLPMIEGHSLVSESEKDTPIEQPGSFEDEDKLMDVFTRLAKEKLEGMMSGLLEAMVERLRSGQDGSKEPDIEASPHHSSEQYESLGQPIRHDKHGTVVEDKLTDTDSASEDSFSWDFKRTKTDAQIAQEDKEKRAYFSR